MTNVQSTLKPGQRINFEGRVGTIKQAGAFHIILEDEKGKTVIVPTKQIAEKEIQVESGPEPEIPEKKVEEAVKKIDKEISDNETDRTSHKRYLKKKQTKIEKDEFGHVTVRIYQSFSFFVNFCSGG